MRYSSQTRVDVKSREDRRTVSAGVTGPTTVTRVLVAVRRVVGEGVNVLSITVTIDYIVNSVC